MKGSLLQAQERCSGVDGRGHSPHPAQKYSATKRPLDRAQEQCLRHVSEVPLHSNFCLIVLLWDGGVMSSSHHTKLRLQLTVSMAGARSDFESQVHPSNINVISVIFWIPAKSKVLCLHVSPSCTYGHFDDAFPFTVKASLWIISCTL